MKIQRLEYSLNPSDEVYTVLGFVFFSFIKYLKSIKVKQKYWGF